MPNQSTPSPATANDTVPIQLDREDIILLILEANARLFGKEVLNGVTRLEKLLYLLTMETQFEGIAEFFTFKAHNFGPFSKEVYEAVDFLESCGLIAVREKAYPSYYANAGEAELLEEISDSGEDDTEQGGLISATEKIFSLTPDGQKIAKILREGIHRRRPQDIDDLERIMVKYANLPLNQLIRYVYRRYPKMTEKSIHPEARKAIH